MKKLTLMTAAVAGVLMISAQVYAATSDDIQSDNAAISKDSAAISKDKSVTRHNRAAKAADKANDNYGKQALDSTKIGANQLTTSEKKTEKSVDTGIKQDDKQNLNNN